MLRLLEEEQEAETGRENMMEKI